MVGCGERLSSHCHYWDVQCRYKIQRGINSYATFVQDVGHCAEHKTDYPLPTVFVGLPMNCGIPSRCTIKLDQLLDLHNNAVKLHPEYECEDRTKVYSRLEGNIVLLKAQPQIGKTGTFLWMIALIALAIDGTEYKSLKPAEPRLQYSWDFHMIIKMMFYWAWKVYTEETSEIVFIAVHIYHAYAKYNSDKSPTERMQAGLLSLAIAYSYCCSKLGSTAYNPKDYDQYLEEQVEPKIIKILNPEAMVANIQMYVTTYESELYNSCENSFHLKASFDYIMQSIDPTLYDRVDIPSWIAQLNSNQDQNCVVKDKFDFPIEQLVNDKER